MGHPSGTPETQMALSGFGILRNGILIAAGSFVLPGEQITLFAQLGFIGGDKARFTIRNAAGEVVFGPVEERTDWFSSNVHLEITAPLVEGPYDLEVTELRFLWPDDTGHFNFGVSRSASPPPADKPPGGIGGFLGDLKGLLVVAAVLVAVVAIAPTVSRIGRK